MHLLLKALYTIVQMNRGDSKKTPVLKWGVWHLHIQPTIETLVEGIICLIITHGNFTSLSLFPDIVLPFFLIIENEATMPLKRSLFSLMFCLIVSLNSDVLYYWLTNSWIVIGSEELYFYLNLSEFEIQTWTCTNCSFYSNLQDRILIDLFATHKRKKNIH